MGVPKLFAAAAAALVLSGCAIDPTQSRGDVADTLTMYLYQKPKVFSPLAPANGPDQLVLSFVLESLYGTDTRYRPRPLLAAAPPVVSPDAKSFTIKLKPGLTWSDGTPFGSKDVAFSFTALANPATGSAFTGRFADVVGAAELKSGAASTLAGVGTPDDTTVTIRTSRPAAGLLALVGYLPLLPQHVLGQVPPSRLGTDPFFTKPAVGTGAFRFVGYRTDQYVELAANPRYRQPVPVKKVILKPVSSDVATGQLGTGEMDLAQISPTDLPSVRKLPRIAIAKASSPGFTRIAVNQRQARFQKPEVRQAFLHAIDRKSLVDTVLGGAGSVVNSSFFGDAAPPKPDDYAYDPGEAKRLLAEAGWDPAEPVRLSWVPGQRDRDTTATIVQSQLQAVGVTTELKQVQAGELTQSYADGSFDLALFGGGNYATDPSSVSAIDGCAQAYPAGGNMGHFCDPAFDELMARANATADPAARTALYRQAAALENARAPYLWLYNPDTIWAHATRLHGFTPNGAINNETGMWQFPDWKLG